MEEQGLNEEQKVLLQGKQNELIKLIEALVRLDKSEEWEVVKELVFSKSQSSIERQLLNESLSEKVDINKIYKLQGEWVWSKQFADTKRFVDTLKKQLADIKIRLK